jgi:Sec-independent protein translocase protein TatA
MPDILFIVLLALVIFGPRRLPELATHAGNYLAQFRRMKRELMEQMEAEITKVRVAEEVGKAASEPVATSTQNRN